MLADIGKRSRQNKKFRGKRKKSGGKEDDLLIT